MVPFSIERASCGFGSHIPIAVCRYFAPGIRVIIVAACAALVWLPVVAVAGIAESDELAQLCDKIEKNDRDFRNSRHTGILEYSIITERTGALPRKIGSINPYDVSYFRLGEKTVVRGMGSPDLKSMIENIGREELSFAGVTILNPRYSAHIAILGDNVRYPALESTSTAKTMAFEITQLQELPNKVAEREILACQFRPLEELQSYLGGEALSFRDLFKHSTSLAINAGQGASDNLITVTCELQGHDKDRLFEFEAGFDRESGICRHQKYRLKGKNGDWCEFVTENPSFPGVVAQFRYVLRSLNVEPGSAKNTHAFTFYQVLQAKTSIPRESCYLTYYGLADPFIKTQGVGFMRIAVVACGGIVFFGLLWFGRSLLKKK